MRSGLALLLVATAGCRSLLGFEEASVAAEDAPVPDGAMPCDDTDGDTVCDLLDTCAGHDDALDDDGDGIADGCDAWPCGVEPAAPPALVTQNDIDGARETTVVLTDTQLGGEVTRLLVVDPGQAFDVTAGFSIVDCICPTCLDQIQVGIIVPAATKVCLFDGNPQGDTASTCSTPTTGMSTRQLVAPSAPGQYDIRFRIGQDLSCTSSPSWFAGIVPTPDLTVGVICVR